jgi:hypothetical protein
MLVYPLTFRQSRRRESQRPGGWPWTQGGTPFMECAQTVGIELPLKALVRR